MVDINGRGADLLLIVFNSQSRSDSKYALFSIVRRNPTMYAHYDQTFYIKWISETDKILIL